MCTKKCAHEHTGPAESIRPSLRNGLTAYAALSPETNSSCLRHRRIDGVRAPGRARNTSADLTPATGARTTRFCRTQQRRSSCAGSTAHGFRRPAISLARNAVASTAPRTPRIVTTRTPLFMRRDGVKRTSFLEREKADYFRRAIWTTQITLNRLVKFVLRARLFTAFALAGRAVADPNAC